MAIGRQVLGWILGIAGLCVILTFGTCLYIGASAAKKMDGKVKASAESAGVELDRIKAAELITEDLGDTGVRAEALGAAHTTLRYSAADCSAETLASLADPKTLAPFGFERAECHNGTAVVAAIDL